jgi:uncharacterized protein (DUF433 family)
MAAEDVLEREPLITTDPEVMGGRAVFRGTRIPIEILFENLADGLTLDEIVDSYPGLEREDAVAALQQACECMKTPRP